MEKSNLWIVGIVAIVALFGIFFMLGNTTEQQTLVVDEQGNVVGQFFGFFTSLASSGAIADAGIESTTNNNYAQYPQEENYYLNNDNPWQESNWNDLLVEEYGVGGISTFCYNYEQTSMYSYEDNSFEEFETELISNYELMQAIKKAHQKFPEVSIELIKSILYAEWKITYGKSLEEGYCNSYYACGPMQVTKIFCEDINLRLGYLQNGVTFSCDRNTLVYGGSTFVNGEEETYLEHSIYSGTAYLNILLNNDLIKKGYAYEINPNIQFVALFYKIGPGAGRSVMNAASIEAGKDLRELTWSDIQESHFDNTYSGAKEIGIQYGNHISDYLNNLCNKQKSIYANEELLRIDEYYDEKFVLELDEDIYDFDEDPFEDAFDPYSFYESNTYLESLPKPSLESTNILDKYDNNIELDNGVVVETLSDDTLSTATERSANYMVLRNSELPIVLVENFYMNNPEELRLFSEDEVHVNTHTYKLARGLVQFASSYNLKNIILIIGHGNLPGAKVYEEYFDFAKYRTESEFNRELVTRVKNHVEELDLKDGIKDYNIIIYDYDFRTNSWNEAESEKIKRLKSTIEFVNQYSFYDSLVVSMHCDSLDVRYTTARGPVIYKFNGLSKSQETSTLLTTIENSYNNPYDVRTDVLAYLD